MHRFKWLMILVLLTLFTAGAQAQDVLNAVSLDTLKFTELRNEDAQDKREKYHGQLAMELSRQAILIAVRDELGLRTFDEALGEPTAMARVLPLSLQLDMYLQVGSHVRLLHDGDLVLDHKLPVKWGPITSLRQGVELHEAFSREQVPRALIAAGLKSQPNKWLDAAPVPEQIQALVDEMSLVSQYRAVRALHQLIREEGESPERLWALTRAYSNLAQESRWFFRCQYAVLQARSLLYAQRLRVKAPGHMLSQLSVSYAWVLAGYPKWADFHLTKLDRLFEDDPKPEHAQAKVWALLLRACQMYDQPELDAIMQGGGPTASVAALWEVMTHEFADLMGLTFSSIDKARAVNPLSTRLYYSGYNAMGVSAGHWLTEAAPKHFSVVTGLQLGRIEEGPKPILDLFKKMDGKGLSLRQLTEVGWAMRDLTAKGEDPGELSYAVLGNLIDDANAIHVMYRAAFMRTQWGVDTNEYLRATSPALSRHPFRPLILTFLLPRNDAGQGMQQLLAQFEPTYTNAITISTLARHIPKAIAFANGWKEDDWWGLSMEMYGGSGTELIFLIRKYNYTNHPKKNIYARWMSDCDLHHPMRIAARIRFGELKAEQITHLTKKYGHQALVVHALAERAEQQEDIGVAREYAKLAASAAPERTTLERLARLELLHGDEVKWLAAMKAILRLPDHSLDHALINQIIAHTYMNQGRFEDALPYAKAAADSWMQNALETYAFNLAVVGDYDEAKVIGQRLRERYRAWDTTEQSVQVWAGVADAKRMSAWYERYTRKQHGNKPSEVSWRMMFVEMTLGQYEEMSFPPNGGRGDQQG